MSYKSRSRTALDSAVLSSDGLSTDESLLMGESVPVRKVPWDSLQKIARSGGDDLPFVYSGTLVVQGQGLSKVLAIGSQTEMGSVGNALILATATITAAEISALTLNHIILFPNGRMPRR